MSGTGQTIDKEVGDGGSCIKFIVLKNMFIFTMYYESLYGLPYVTLFYVVISILLYFCNWRVTRKRKRKERRIFREGDLKLNQLALYEVVT